MVDIMENLDEWISEFASGWLAHYKETGETNFKIYQRPKNKQAPAGKGVDLSQSRLIFISSAGGYLKDSQEPFDAENDLGDYNIRTFPIDTPFEQIAYAHTHYDHAAVNEDPQVLLPLKHLAAMVDEGKIGELAPMMISFMGYQPDAERTVKETIPAVIEAVKAQNADAALLVPA